QQGYDLIVRRFLSIFYPPAVYQKAALVTKLGGEQFFANFRILMEEGYLAVAPNTFEKKKKDDESEETGGDAQMLEALMKLRKGEKLPVRNVKIKEGETTPPKRYNSGSMILAMENAGQLIEDEELRAQIKGSGIGTSATRAEILNKLVKNKYIALNKKTQIITPTLLGENIFDVVNVSIRSLLNPELTASWEKGLTYVAEGQITPEEYMGKLENFVSRHTQQVKESRQHTAMRPYFEAAAVYYKKEKKK
ncbi:MAG: type IA DNA topoisomerase, partial [Lachnospiraceae bacterium]|nr:type IA DNA topoisomerase [Lachnospiraceae bacterium]